jgi:tetratricopeptide (TPR) repeat protein
MRILTYFLMMTVLWSSLPVFGQTTDNRGVGNQPNTQTNEKRLALVIGNSAYQNVDKLRNPVNDANDMAAALRKLGFEVMSGTDLTLPQMRKMVREFGTKLQQQKGVGLFYYAGHGVQVGGRNYLIPVDANIETETETPDYSVDTDLILRFMRDAGNKFNMMILDACRNNPFARSWRQYSPNRNLTDDNGLVRITPPSGTVILYSTEPGSVASDGKERNGLFTESFLAQINKPNIEFDALVKLIASDVRQKSDRKQSPWKEGLYDGEFYFVRAQSEKLANSTQITQSGISFLPFIPIPEKNINEAERIAKIGEELHKKQDCPLAILNFTDALKLDPNSDFAYSRRGECYRMLGNFDKAIEDLNEAIRKNPQNDYAYSSRGVAYWQKGQTDLVLKDLDEAIRLNDKQFWAYLMRGDFQRQNGDCNKAVIDLTKAIWLSPEDQFGYLIRSDAYLCQNNFEKAISDLNYVLKINPNSIDALEQRLDIYFQKKEFNGALGDSSRLIQLNPKESERYYFLRARFYFQQMLFKEAIQEFTKVINQNGEIKSIAYSFRGFANGADGNKILAFADLNKAIELSKIPLDMIFAYALRSIGYLAEEDIKKSLADIETALKIKIDDKEVEPLIKSGLFFTRASIQFERKKFELALADINLAISLYSNMSEYYMTRAEIYRKIGKIAEAIADEQKAQELIQ